MRLEVVEAWTTTAEEKAAVATVVMEAARKEVVEAVPHFKASEAFMEEV